MVAIAVVAIKQVVLVIQIRDKQIEKAVIVVIAPGASVADGGVIHDAGRRNPGERAVAIVPIKKVVLARSAGRTIRDE